MDATATRPPDIRERKDDQWREKASFWIAQLKTVGFPLVFSLSVMVYVFGVAIGYWPSPFITATRFEQAHKEIGERHEVMISNQSKIAEALDHQTAVLSEGVEALKDIRCEVNKNDADRLKCYRKQGR